MSSSDTIVFQRSAGNSAIGATCWMPAFATITSSRPNFSSAALTLASFASAFVRSASNGMPGPSGSGLRSTLRTSIPSLGRAAAATARPIPLAAPVTSAALPCC